MLQNTGELWKMGNFTARGGECNRECKFGKHFENVSTHEQHRVRENKVSCFCLIVCF